MSRPDGDHKATETVSSARIVNPDLNAPTSLAVSSPPASSSVTQEVKRDTETEQQTVKQDERLRRPSELRRLKSLPNLKQVNLEIPKGGTELSSVLGVASASTPVLYPKEDPTLSTTNATELISACDLGPELKIDGPFKNSHQADLKPLSTLKTSTEVHLTPDLDSINIKQKPIKTRTASFDSNKRKATVLTAKEVIEVANKIPIQNSVILKASATDSNEPTNKDLIRKDIQESSPIGEQSNNL